MRVVIHIFLLCLLLLFDVFISVYAFVYTQTLVNGGDLSETSRGINLCWWAHYSCYFSFCLLLLMLNDIRSFRNNIFDHLVGR